jgi:hypothetical protein
MASLTQPLDSSSSTAQLGLSYIVAEEIRMELAEKLNVWQLGVVPLVGDFAGAGTTTIRVTHVGGIGWDAKMVSMPTETSAPTMANPTAGYSSVTLGRFGLGFSETFQNRIVSQPNVRAAMGGEAFRSQAANTWFATFREQVCVTGATISASVGSAATTLSVDNLIALATAFNTTDGAEDGGAPVVMLDPQQIEEAKASARSEPAFQGDLAGFTSVQGVAGRIYDNFLGLGMTVVGTGDIQQSGGAYQGFAFQRGGIGYGAASTSPLALGPTVNPVYVDEYGLVVYDVLNGQNQQTNQVNAIAFMGFALGSTDVFFQRRVLSTT